MTETNELIRAVLNMRETRRAYLNAKSICTDKRLQGLAPHQYETELKEMNDTKALFFQSVQRVLDEGDKVVERYKRSDSPCGYCEGTGRIPDDLLDGCCHHCDGRGVL